MTTDGAQGSLLRDERIRVRLTVDIPLEEGTTVAQEGSEQQEQGANVDSLASDEGDGDESLEMDPEVANSTAVASCAPKPTPVALASETKSPHQPETPAIDRTEDPADNQTKGGNAEPEVRDEEQNHTADSSTSTASDKATADLDGVPAHRDPERLQAVYDQYETFGEMTDALDTDVTAQTVRYHMIKQGIHNPGNQVPSEPNGDDDSTPDSESTEPPKDRSDNNRPVDEPDEKTDEQTRETADDREERGSGDIEQQSEDTETTPALQTPDELSQESEHEGVEEGGQTDSITDEAEDDDTDDAATADTDVTDISIPSDVELPSHLTIEDIQEAVIEAKTLYEVQQRLRIGRNKARKLLSDLNLLDFVVGRAATVADRDVSREDIYNRIKQAVN
ncbi:hypothetical protein [Haladaptatus sp. NG-SE-30]